MGYPVYLYLCYVVPENPWVLQHAIKTQASLGVLHKQFADQITRLGADMSWKVQVHFCNSSVCLAVPFGLKRRGATQKLESQHPQRPYVDGRIVITPFHHFRWQIIQRST